MTGALRPALALAAERLRSGLDHLVGGIRWASDSLPGDETHDASHYGFVCGLRHLQEAADIADLIHDLRDVRCGQCGAMPCECCGGYSLPAVSP